MPSELSAQWLCAKLMHLGASHMPAHHVPKYMRCYKAIVLTTGMYVCVYIYIIYYICIDIYIYIYYIIYIYIYICIYIYISKIRYLFLSELYFGCFQTFEDSPCFSVPVYCSCVSVVNFEHVISGWGKVLSLKYKILNNYKNFHDSKKLYFCKKTVKIKKHFILAVFL